MKRKKKYWAMQVNFIEDLYKKKSKEFSPEVYRMKIVKEFLNQQKIKSLLDFGCGTGDLIANCKGISKTVGIDNSKEMIEICQNKYPKNEFVNTTLKNYNPHKKFDAITALSVLPYIENDSQIYKKIYFLLKPQGKFCVSFPNQLFNMFTNNNITYEFLGTKFYNYLNNKKILNYELKNIKKSTIAKYPKSSARGTVFLREENPITIDKKFEKFGFKIYKKIFLNIHPVTPNTMKKFGISKSSQEYIQIQKKLKEDWRSYFLASTFLVIAEKQ